MSTSCPLPAACPDSRLRNSLLPQRVREALRSWLALLRAMVRAAAKRDELSSKIDAKAVPNLILAALEGGVMMSRLEPDDNALCKLQGHLKHYLDSEAGVQ